MMTSINAQSITTNKNAYFENEPIIIDYSGGTDSPLDWIGIYSSGQIPGQIASTSWKYIPNKAGNITFENTLSPGLYDVHLLCCDGYKILASKKSIKIERKLMYSRLKHYIENDSIFITIYNPIDNKKLSIFRSEDVVDNKPKNGSVPIFNHITQVKNNENSIRIKIENTALGEYFAFYESITMPEIFDVNPQPILPLKITKIGLGSCGNHKSRQKVLTNIYEEGIDLFLYLGDNLYIDTYEENVMKFKYEDFLTSRTEFQKLRSKVPILATWDDHDYGCCDEGSLYPLKKKSQKIFLDFYGEPANSIRRNQDGIFTSYYVGDQGQKLQIILLDTRFFLSNRKPNNGCGINDYCPWDITDTKTMLGDAQWQWLKDELLKPADLRMIASSVQFSSSYHGFESWTLFPHEQKKMLDLINETKA
ncbi:MAG: Alkaline phosphatase precursor, partial [Bacteroidota bacterium]